MSRFGNLEFNEGPVTRPPAVATAATKDESFYLNEAHRAFADGQFQPALRSFSKVLEFNPRNPAAWIGQVRMLIELGEAREARLWADKALEQFPHEPELLAAKAVALGRTGDLQGALSFSDAALEERGDSPYIWLARADVLLARRESRADYCFDRALALAPEDWFIAWLAARIRYHYRQFVLAVKLLHQALAWNTTHFRLWLELGQSQLALGLVGPATTSFERARELNPQSEAVRAALTQAAQTDWWTRFTGWCRQTFLR